MPSVSQLDRYVHYFVHLLKGPATFAFDLYVRQAYIYGIEDLFLGIVLLATSCAAYPTLKYVKDLHRNCRDQSGFSCYHKEGAALATIAGFIAVGLGIVALLSGMSWLLNPYWRAIQMVLGR